MYQVFIILIVIFVIFWLTSDKNGLLTSDKNNLEGFYGYDWFNGDEYLGSKQVSLIYLHDFLDYIDWYQTNSLTTRYKPGQHYWYIDTTEDQLELRTRQFMDILYYLINGNTTCSNLYKNINKATTGIVYQIRNNYNKYEFDVDMDALKIFVDELTTKQQKEKEKTKAFEAIETIKNEKLQNTLNDKNANCEYIYKYFIQLIKNISNTPSYREFVNNNRSQAIYAGYAKNTYLVNV